MLKKELAFIKENLSEFEKVFIAQQEENKKLYERIEFLEKKVTEKDELIEQLNQYSRRNNVIIDGVPETAGEKPIDTVRRIAKATGFKIEDRDIDGVSPTAAQAK